MSTRIVSSAVLAAFLAAAPLAAQEAAKPAAPVPAAKSADPKENALRSWIEGVFPWGDGEVSVGDVPDVKVPGYHMIRTQKQYVADSRMNDQCFAALDDDGKVALLGDILGDDEKVKNPASAHPVQSAADLAGLRAKLKSALHMGVQLALDPATDRKGWKGVKILCDAGYGGSFVIGALVSLDGTWMIVGRAWDRTRSIAAQRKELIALSDAPSQGPADAKVSVVEYSDMQCPYCKKRTSDFEALTSRLAKELPIKRYIKFFPIAEHPWAFRAASAGWCLYQKDPSLFFRWKSNVYSRQEELTVSDLDAFAVDFASANDVSEKAFQDCYLKDASNTRVLRDLTESYTVRVRSAPSYFFDGVLVSWFSDNLMEEFLRKTYLKGAGLPLPTPAAKTGEKKGQESGDEKEKSGAKLAPKK